MNSDLELDLEVRYIEITSISISSYFHDAMTPKFHRKSSGTLALPDSFESNQKKNK